MDTFGKNFSLEFFLPVCLYAKRMLGLSSLVFSQLFFKVTYKSFKKIRKIAITLEKKNFQIFEKTVLADESFAKGLKPLG